MPVAWKTLEAKDRLLAAVIAAHGDKKLLDYRKIATYYGKETTYDAIEGQFRIIRKQAEKLREAVGTGEQEQAPPRGGATPKAKSVSTPKTSNGSAKTKKFGPAALTDGVISGRVTKSKSPDKSRKPQPLNRSFDSRVVDLTDDRFAKTGSNQIMGVREDILSSDGSVVTADDDDGDGHGDFADLDGFGNVDWTLGSF